jgi:hypothetical protein
MRNTILSVAFAGTLLAGCASVGGVPTVLGISAAEVQQDAIAICSFLPTASTVANIIAVGNPLLTTAEAIAQAICASVTAPPVASTLRRVGTPTVAGVVIKGRFIK